MKKRIIALLLTLALLPTLLPLRGSAAEKTYENTHENTGNQIEDLIAVALSQLGYKEGDNNDTKYGDWYKLPNQPWCAMFVSWCAYQAEISTKIIDKSAMANPKNFGLEARIGSAGAPKRGDIFFKQDFSHCGIVVSVEGSYIVTVEGNSNNDGGEEGYWVVQHRRRYADLLFATPKYTNCSASHNFSIVPQTAHPHKNMYICKTCGKSYETGGNGYSADCSKCTSCGCKPAAAGVYTVTSGARAKVYENHSTAGWPIGYLEAGERVEVLALGGSWAHIRHAGRTGYVLRSRVKKYLPSPEITLSAVNAYRGDSVTMTWKACEGAGRYLLSVTKDGEDFLSKTVQGALTYTLSSLTPGKYQISLASSDGYNASAATVKTVTVLDRFTITYHAGEGTGAPAAQTKYEDKLLTLSSTKPTRSGYNFFGWTTEKGGIYPTCQPGQSWSENADTDLYAVWQKKGATKTSLTVYTPAEKTLYLLKEKLDTTGLTLLLNYSDGTAQRITRDFTVSGFRSDKEGTYTLTISYGGFKTSYEVRVVDHIPGDVDLNRQVNKEDVMQLLWHITFPDRFPISVPADFTKDGKVDKEDVMKLLWHVTFPDKFPLDYE